MGNVIVSNITRTPVENGSNWGSVAAPAGPTPNLLFDGFESSDMSSPNSGDGINTSNFAWEGNYRTAVVTMTGGSPYKIYENGTINVLDTTTPQYDGTPKTGDNSLRFKFMAIGTGTSDDNKFVEQNWTMPIAEGHTDFWQRLRFKVPANYTHENTLGGNENNKLLFGFANGYTSVGTGFGFNLRPMAGGSSSLLVSWMEGDQQPSFGGQGEHSYGKFIDVATDLDRWIDLVVRFKCATSDGANDGEIHTYYKKDGESSYTELLTSSNGYTNEAITGINTYVGAGLTGIRAGYLFGYHNTAYVEDTVFLVDDVQISTNSLVT